ncbi:MAG: hypothetical protein KKF77_06530 [Proteobacteria bacterium]|nr:hypothetical protein [Pseudomonadota bacterium]
MFTKAGLLIAVALVLFGYRWGRRRAQARMAPPPAQPTAAPAADSAPKKEWLSVKALLVIVAVLLIIAILSSLGGKIG